jgi:competence protein ComEC
VPNHRGLAALREAAQQAGAAWTTITAPHAASIGDVRIVVHHPPPPDWERPAVRNDDSLVLELQYGRVRIVLPGDIGRDVERTLARSMPGGGCVILKVPHHGSASSSSGEWLARLAPSIAIVSAGRANRYGHPVPAVLSRYADLGTRVLRTDRDGAILVETDGYAVDVKTMVEPR